MEIKLPKVSDLFTLRLKNIDWPRTVLLVAALLACVSAVVNWYRPARQIVTQQFVPTKEIVEKKIEVPGPVRIKVIEKRVVENKIPGLVIPEKSNVLATGETPPSEAGFEAVAIQDESGETVIQAKEKELSLIGFPNNKEVAIRYGLSARDAQQGTVSARWQFLRVGKVYVGAYGEVTTKPDAKAMLEASYRF